MSDLNFSRPNKDTKLGESNVKFFIGKVVGYNSMKEQIEKGSGWYYKVRILGDHGIKDEIPDEQLDYVQSLLPTTAGSGAAYKMRSVRISQGDTVFGIRGGGKGGKPFIIAVFPRTRNTKVTDGKFGTLSGFYGSLNKNGTLSGEFNDQIGPATPGTTTLDPKLYNKSNRDDPSGNLEQLGYDVNQDGEIDDVEAKLTPPRIADDKKWEEGEPINSGQLKYILSNNSIINSDSLENEESTAYITKVLEQAVKQEIGGIDKDIADKVLTDLKNGNTQQALERIFPPPPPTSD